MWPRLLVSPFNSIALSKALAVFETEQADQAVHIVCSPKTAMCVLTESEVLMGAAQVARLVEPLCDFQNGIVCFLYSERNETARQELQLHLLLTLGLKSLPVASLDQAAELAERQRKSGGAKEQPVAEASDASVALMNIPSVSKKRAAILLDRFGSVKKIALASEQDLVAAVGKVAGASVHKFFTKPLGQH